MFSLFTKSSIDNTLGICPPRIKNRDLPWQLQQPPLLQRLKRKTYHFLRIFFMVGAFLFIVIMSFGDGTSAKKALVNFSIVDTWQSAVALERKYFNDKAEEAKTGSTLNKQ